MTITDQIAEIEARLRDAEQKLEMERRRNDQQAGALRESRAQNSELLANFTKEITEARELIGTYQTHFHAFHGSADHIKAQERTLAAAIAPPAPPVEEPTTLIGRISRLRAKAEAAA